MEFRYWGNKVIVQPNDMQFYKKLESDSCEKLKNKLKNNIRTFDKIKILFLSSIIMTILFVVFFLILLSSSSALLLKIFGDNAPFIKNNISFLLIFVSLVSIYICFFIVSKKIFPKLKKRFLKEKYIIHQAEKLKHKEARKEFYKIKITSIELYASTHGLEILQNLGHIKISSNTQLNLENKLKLKAYNSGANAVINVQYTDSTVSTIKSSFNGIGVQRSINTKHKTTYHITGDLAIISRKKASLNGI